LLIKKSLKILKG